MLVHFKTPVGFQAIQQKNCQLLNFNHKTTVTAYSVECINLWNIREIFFIACSVMELFKRVDHRTIIDVYWKKCSLFAVTNHITVISTLYYLHSLGFTFKVRLVSFSRYDKSSVKSCKFYPSVCICYLQCGWLRWNFTRVFDTKRLQSIRYHVDCVQSSAVLTEHWILTDRDTQNHRLHITLAQH